MNNEGLQKMKKTILCLLMTGLSSVSGLSQTTKSDDSVLNFGLGSLPLMTDVETRLISPENPTGEKGKGGTAIPDRSHQKQHSYRMAGNEDRYSMDRKRSQHP